MRTFYFSEFSEIIHATVWMSCTEHIQGFSEILNDWMFHTVTTPSPWSSKMSEINLVTLLWKYDNIL